MLPALAGTDRMPRDHAGAIKSTSSFIDWRFEAPATHRAYTRTDRTSDVL